MKRLLIAAAIAVAIAAALYAWLTYALREMP